MIILSTGLLVPPFLLSHSLALLYFISGEFCYSTLGYLGFEKRKDMLLPLLLLLLRRRRRFLVCS